MMNKETNNSDFFVAGGTVRPDSRSYVERSADDKLFELVLRGHICYVLTPRQMGKSSLMIHTAARLKKQGVSTAIIDFTSIGIDNVTMDQWYVGQLDRLKEGLHLSVDPQLWWQERTLLSHVQRFSNFLRDVVLTEVVGQVVIFIDEIGATINFDDRARYDYFAAIRAMHNARANNPDLKRLTFVLLGTASPLDLIKDPTQTPFNIGKDITLEEFSQNEAQVLQKGLKNVSSQQIKAIFERIYHWTSGYPYLTQKLCQEVAQRDQKDSSDEQIDALVEKLFLDEAAVRKESNLQFIQNRILKNPQRRQLLNLYQEVCEGQKVTHDAESLIQNQLKLSGLVKVENGYLQIRNHIYRRVFDLEWVKEYTPNGKIVRIRVIMVAAAVFLLFLFSLLAQSTWASFKVQEIRAQFHEPDIQPAQQVALLADLFQLQAFVPPADYDYKARELFYSLSRDEQEALFETANEEEEGDEEEDEANSDIINLVQGLYITLADVDGTDRTRPLLETMVKALEELDEIEETTDLQDEINSWLQGRAFYRQNQYIEAHAQYKQALALNGQNPATLYERGQVLTKLKKYEKALADMESVVMIGRRVSVPAPATPTLETAPLQATPTFTSSMGITQTEPSITFQPTPSALISEFDTSEKMIKMVMNSILSHPELAKSLAVAPTSQYPTLRGVVSSLTETIVAIAQLPTNTEVPPPYEPNDTQENAYGPVISGQVYEAYSDDLDDWYYFVLEQTSSVEIEVKNYHATGQLVMYLEYLDEDNQPQRQPLANDGRRLSTLKLPNEFYPDELKQLPAGKYLVRIYTIDNYNTNELYRLSIRYE